MVEASPEMSKAGSYFQRVLVPFLRDVEAAASSQRDDIGDSDLYDEQPVTLMVQTDLGKLRGARAALRSEVLFEHPGADTASSSHARAKRENP